MRIRNLQRHGEEKIELQMTPMIDIVFLLLIFFITTFKIISPEGDFNIRMPQEAPSESESYDDLFPPIKVTLRAHGDGSLATIQMGQRSLGSFTELHEEIRGIVGDDPGPGSIAEGPEVEFDCDYQLKFKHIIDAITAVSGYVHEGEIIKVVDKISFTPPHHE